MSRPGRLVLASMRPDAPGAVAERVRQRQAAERAHAEMLTRFSPLTPANARAAIDWQSARIRELCEEAS